ncbi:AMP-dependent synthetase/ligase [Sphingopyxis sp.]|uniref:AMP-dependent synthetase/ligase n=1 Tax=Sphingopyxis sp. TaxID=1908224 RepID=UPI003D6D6A11
MEPHRPDRQAECAASSQAADDRAWRQVRDMIAGLAAADTERVVLREKVRGVWRDWTWQRLTRAIADIGAAALAQGFKPGDVGCILAQTRPDWLAADLGLQCVGMASAGLYPTEPAAKLAWLVNDCGARIVFVDTAEQVAKLREIRDRCPGIARIVIFDEGAVPREDPLFVSLAAWCASGRAALARDPAMGVVSDGRLASDSTAMIVYTSGTTGRPKGAIITHGNIVSQVTAIGPALAIESGWRRPAFLPLCHIAERSMGYVALANGVVSSFVDGPAALGPALPEIRPQLMLGVPRVYEKIRAAGDAWIESAPEPERTALRGARDRAMVIAGAAMAGEKVDAAMQEELAALQAGPLSALRAALGLDRARRLLCGGARIPIDVHGWMRAIGVPVDDIYGMTECGTVTLSRDSRRSPGLVGTPLPHGTVRLSQAGEILVRGPHVFAGYLNLPDKTADALRDGWLYTGDVGRIDTEGRLILIDRIKDIIITSSGKNIAPSAIEAALCATPHIAEAVVAGDGRHYLTALILPDPDAMARTLAERGQDGDATSPAAHALVAEDVRIANLQLSRIENVRDFRILRRAFVPGDEEVTATLKIRRSIILRNHAALVDEMYAPAA